MSFPTLLPSNPAARSDEPGGSGAHKPDELHAETVRRLFEEHNRSLVYFLAARLRSVAEARDVAQEAYVRLLQLDNPGAISFLRAYLFRIAANLAVDRLRHRKVKEVASPREFFETLLTRPSPERTVLAEQQLDVIVAALGQLPEKCREAFALHYFAERTIDDIAVSSGVSARMIQKYVARALAHCRASLADREPMNSPDAGQPLRSPGTSYPSSITSYAADGDSGEPL
jgi:RNA polymerase sigma factor (sigma-70 family)